MMRRPRYTYYSYTDSNYRGNKKYRAKKREKDDYEIIKDDTYKLCYDVKKLFNKRKNTILKKSKNRAYTANEKTGKLIFLGFVSLMLMSVSITFPGVLLICFIGYLLYFFRKEY